MTREVSISSIRELGVTLRRVRKESGLTQRDAAAEGELRGKPFDGSMELLPVAKLPKELGDFSLVFEAPEFKSPFGRVLPSAMGNNVGWEISGDARA